MPAPLVSAWKLLLRLVALVLFIGSLIFAALSALAQERVDILAPQAHIGDAKRLALVIGNSAYNNFAALRNTINDATAVAAELRQIGYEVYFGRDLDRRDMNAAISNFLSHIEPGSEVLAYYAGHGVELQGSNFLLPVDVPKLRADEERLLRSEAINLTELLLDLQGRAARVSLVILDACRDNPFQVAGVTRSLGTKRGLGRVDPPQGAFVIFSAGVGEDALDNLGDKDHDPNGLFTRNLLRLIAVEGMELRSMVRQLRSEVREAALANGERAQVPSYYDQLLGDFYFRSEIEAEAHPMRSSRRARREQRGDIGGGSRACIQSLRAGGFGFSERTAVRASSL
jgi:Caspase domain